MQADNSDLVTVVGIGAGGWADLADAPREVLRNAGVIFGSERQLDLLPAEVGGERVPWPSPLLPALPALLQEPRPSRPHARQPHAREPQPGQTQAGQTQAGQTQEPGTPHAGQPQTEQTQEPGTPLTGKPHAGQTQELGTPRESEPPQEPGVSRETAAPRCVLASGDPMFHGIGATLVRLLGAENVRVLPHPSSASLAAARLGWSLAATDVLSLVTGEVASLRRLLNPGRRILVLSRGADTPAEVAAELTAAGYGGAWMTVLSQLGGPDEQVTGGAAGDWAKPAGDPLNVIGVDCGDGPATSVVPGLPDEAYGTDGQLTKREVRAVTLAALGPVPGALLWDVGGGSGSIGIEWMRAHPACRAIAIEPNEGRAATIRANAAKLGVPGLRVVEGRAPEALAGLPTPDTIFIGGGLTRDGVLETCLAALRDGGRLVANAVTVESEAVLAEAYRKFGGELTRLTVSRGSPVGGFTGWRTMMPVTIWSVTR